MAGMQVLEGTACSCCSSKLTHINLVRASSDVSARIQPKVYGSKWTGTGFQSLPGRIQLAGTQAGTTQSPEECHRSRKKLTTHSQLIDCLPARGQLIDVLPIHNKLKDVLPTDRQLKDVLPTHCKEIDALVAYSQPTDALPFRAHVTNGE